ncbi:rRNA maturation RNase YbeY [Roseivirga sp. E12]|uniref:rRNA maturation RNase YbeY n=1 Tax=Roseivirga sp. E12 TaxID=2819237 RepID=UPI001ABC6411|nr:rRNA maturation RNase YbeY [Roseivirga sp. E12]MBO3698761.1 rRNA maturation RNase YbeY [Roseivirga sp. E12]
MSKINFFQEEISFPLSHKRILKSWISQVVEQHDQIIDSINFIYCSDNYLLKVNQQYLDHDYYTDIITFDNREDDSAPIDSDIFISIDRVKDNAKRLKIPYKHELHRVMIHGILHLLGKQDKTEAQKTEMRKSEEASLSLLHI